MKYKVVIFGLLVAGLAGAQNLLPNGGMEKGSEVAPTGFYKSGPDQSLLRWGKPAASGEKAIGIVDDNIDGHAAWVSRPITLAKEVAGKSLRLNWVERYNIDKPGVMRVTVTFFDASNGLIKKATVSHIIRGKSPAWDEGGFSPAGKTVKVPVEAVSMRIQLVSGGAADVTGEVWIDDLTVEPAE